MDVTIRQLRAAIAVAKYLSFRKAAENVYISQPALSTSIAELESNIGIKLFDRTSRSVKITADGTSFITRVSRILDDLDQLIADTNNAIKQRKGLVIVSAVSSVAGRLISSAIMIAAEIYPELKIRVQDDVASRVLTLARNGEVDFAVTVKPKHIEEDMVFEPRMTDPFFLVCHKNDKLASAKRITWKSIEKSRLIALSTSSGAHEIVENELIRNNVQMLDSIMVSHLSTIHGMLETGFGISILPKLALPVTDHPRLVIRQIAGSQISRTLGIYRRKDRSLSAAAKGFVEALDKSITNYENATQQLKY